MLRLLLLLILIPLVELLILIEIGQWIGTISTIALVLLTGIWGLWLARQQGLEAMNRARYELTQGHMPAEPLIDGIFVFLAGVLLVVPGVLTDLIAFLALVPATRKLIKRFVWRLIQKPILDRHFQVTVHVPPPGFRQAPHVDPRGTRDEQVTVRRVHPILVEHPSDEKNSRQ